MMAEKHDIVVYIGEGLLTMVEKHRGTRLQTMMAALLLATILHRLQFSWLQWQGMLAIAERVVQT